MVSRTFSIITANYNSGEKLLSTAMSVLDQADVEYIIVDGGSTDGSRELAADMAERHRDRLRLISEPDRGPYDAMNKGIRLARGRYLMFLGSGDLLTPGALARISPQLPVNNRALVYGDVSMGGERYDGPFDWRKLCVKNICHQSVFYGRDVFRLCGNFDLRYRLWADYEMNLRCFGRRRIAKVYCPLVVAEYEGGGISSVCEDPEFLHNRRHLIRRHLGITKYVQLRAPTAMRNLGLRVLRMLSI